MPNYKCNLLLAGQEETPIIEDGPKVILYEKDEFNLTCKLNTIKENTTLTWNCGTFKDIQETINKTEGNITTITNIVNGTADRKLNNQNCTCTEGNENSSASVHLTVYCKYESISFIIGAFGDYRVIGYVCLSVCLSVCASIFSETVRDRKVKFCG